MTWISFPCGWSASTSSRKLRKSSRFLYSVNFVLTWPVPTSRAANRFSVPWRLYVLFSPRTTLPLLVASSSQPPQGEALATFRNGGERDAQFPSDLLNLLALQASQNDPRTLHGVRLRCPALREGHQTRLVFDRTFQFGCVSGHPNILIQICINAIKHYDSPMRLILLVSAIL